MGEHGDTTEVSGGGAGGGEEDCGEDTKSDSAAYKDSDLECEAPTWLRRTGVSLLRLVLLNKWAAAPAW